jgi:DNA-binding response OmpR family regulator
MAASRVIVCEQTGRWAAALRVAFEPATPGIVETRSLAECGERLAQWPRSLAAVELTTVRLDAVLEWLLHASRDFAEAQIVVLADRGLEHYELLARELGALHFTTSPRQLDQLLPTLRLLESSRPAELSVSEQIMAELPWGE